MSSGNDQAAIEVSVARWRGLASCSIAYPRARGLALGYTLSPAARASALFLPRRKYVRASAIHESMRRAVRRSNVICRTALLMKRAYYSSTIERFLDASSEEIIGTLTINSGFAVEPTQRDAWLCGGFAPLHHPALPLH
jgi:hypothetical protein